ncbi:MAG TPA: hypothetical protein VKA09_02470 [Nitrososphaeraceae archaeon]|nr:hypothetical protein [Nitrososphaeraceae archaeon]
MSGGNDSRSHNNTFRGTITTPSAVRGCPNTIIGERVDLPRGIT